MKKERNQKKRYGLLVLLLILSWLAVAWILWRVDPDNIKNIIVPGIYLPMLMLVFGALFLLFSIIFMSAKRALRWSGGATFFLLLRVLDLGSILNGFLLLGILIAWEIHLIRNKSKDIDFKELDSGSSPE